MSLRLCICMPACGFVGAAIIVAACKVPVAPETKAACDIVQAVDPNGAVQRVCAVADDIATIVDAVNAARAEIVDAGARFYASAAPAGCTTIPTTNVCATNAELLRGIARVKAAHAADGGTKP